MRKARSIELSCRVQEWRRLRGLAGSNSTRQHNIYTKTLAKNQIGVCLHGALGRAIPRRAGAWRNPAAAASNDAGTLQELAESGVNAFLEWMPDDYGENEDCGGNKDARQRINADGPVQRRNQRRLVRIVK